MCKKVSEKMKTIRGALLFLFAFAAALMPVTETGALAAAQTDVSYMAPSVSKSGNVKFDADGNVKFKKKKLSKNNYIQVSSSSNQITWGNGPDTTTWYVVKGNVKIKERISISGNVNLILCDGCELMVPKGINLASNVYKDDYDYDEADYFTYDGDWADPDDERACEQIVYDKKEEKNSLTIYSQKKGTGKLLIDSVPDECAAIGGPRYNDCGILTINGGVISVKSTDYAAAIGGGREGNGGYITINGGSITLNGNGTGEMGIGGGQYASCQEVIINGGNVDISGFRHGIGCCSIPFNTQKADVQINGGQVHTGDIYACNIKVTGGLFDVSAPDNNKGAAVKVPESKLNPYGIDMNGVCFIKTKTGGAYVLEGEITEKDLSDVIYATNKRVMVYKQKKGLLLEKTDSETIKKKIGTVRFVNFGSAENTAPVFKVLNSDENGKTVKGAKVTAKKKKDGSYTLTLSCTKDVPAGMLYIQAVFGKGADKEKSENYITVPIVEKTDYLEPEIQDGEILKDEAGEVKFSEASAYALAVDENTDVWGETGKETWYVVNRDVNIGSGVSVAGKVNLILADGCRLNVPEGIEIFGLESENTGGVIPSDSEICEKASLNVYGQASGNGELVIGKKENETDYLFAGISYFDYDYQYCDVTVNGGIITIVKREGTYYGIHCTCLTVNGGTVNSGSEVDCDKVNVNGGTVLFENGISSNESNISGGRFILCGPESMYGYYGVFENISLYGKVYGLTWAGSGFLTDGDSVKGRKELKLNYLTNMRTALFSPEDGEKLYSGEDITDGKIVGKLSLLNFDTEADDKLTFKVYDSDNNGKELDGINVTAQKSEENIYNIYLSCSGKLPADRLFIQTVIAEGTENEEKSVNCFEIPVYEENFAYTVPSETESKSASAVPLTANDTILGNIFTESRYVVNSDVVFEDTVMIAGDVNLILCDGCTMTLEKGTDTLSDGISLKIYGQEEGSGTIIVEDDINVGNIEINGGIINVSKNAVYAGSLVINGGEISNRGVYAGSTVLNGGRLKINSNGIGKGDRSDGTLLINGGLFSICGGKYVDRYHDDSTTYYDAVNGGIGQVSINTTFLARQKDRAAYNVFDGLSSTDGLTGYNLITNEACAVFTPDEDVQLVEKKKKKNIYVGSVDFLNFGGDVRIDSEEDITFTVFDSEACENEAVGITAVPLFEDGVCHMMVSTTKKLKSGIVYIRTCIERDDKSITVQNIIPLFIYAKKVSYLEPVLENDKFVYDEEAAEVRLQGAEVTAFPLTGDCRTIGTAGAETWYFAEGDIDINDRLAVEGNVNLILCDGCNLTVVDGITVNEGDSLTFYGQKMRTGVLTAKGIKNNKAVIGGEGGYTNGNITVNGGNINAVVGFKGTHSWGFADEGSFAGIGGGWGGSGKNITINAGTVYAKGGNGAAGIGGSGYNNCTDITINGGKVHAVGGSGGAGIGGGYYGDASNIIINGGYVRAIGEGAGIGGGTDDYDTEDMDDGEYEEWSYERLGMPLRSLMGKVRNLQINGGTVEATGDYCAMGSPYSTSDELIEDTITVADDCVIYAGSDEETAVPVEKSNYLNGTMNYKYIKIDF